MTRTTAKICGVYCLVFESGHYYYGQSTDIALRFAAHLSKLRLGRHANAWMRGIYGKCGAPSLRVTCLADPSSLDEAEQLFLDDHHGRPYCLNLAPDASAPARGHRQSPEVRELKRQLGKKSWASGHNALLSFIGANTANLLRPDVREKIRNLKKTDESKRRDSETRMALHQDPKFRAAHLAGVARHFEDVEQQGRRLAALKLKHADKEFTDKRTKAASLACAKQVVCLETGRTWASASAWQQWVSETYSVVASTVWLRKEMPYRGANYRYR